MIENETLRIIRNRCSLRRFDPRPIPPEIEDAIIEAAMRAPTASNMMYYSIINVHNPETKRALQESCNHYPYISAAPMMLIFCADYQKWNDYFVQSGVPQKCEEKGKTYTGACERYFVLGADDALLAAENAVIAAESMNLGSCFIGHITSHIEKHRELLCLPPLVTPILMLLIGYPAQPDQRRCSTRFDKKYIVHDDRYHLLSREDLQEMTENRFGCVVPNRFDAENPGQFLYFSKYDGDSYRESARSMHEAMKAWRNEDV